MNDQPWIFLRNIMEMAASSELNMELEHLVKKQEV